MIKANACVQTLPKSPDRPVAPLPTKLVAYCNLDKFFSVRSKSFMLLNISWLTFLFLSASEVSMLLNLSACKACAAKRGACPAAEKLPVLKVPASAFKKASNFSSDKTLDIFAVSKPTTFGGSFFGSSGFFIGSNKLPLSLSGSVCSSVSSCCISTGPGFKASIPAIPPRPARPNATFLPASVRPVI